MRRTIYLLFVWVFAISATTHAQTNAPEKRVLFIVETSKEMKDSSAAGLKLISTLVESGMAGLLSEGDSFGVWTFNENVSIGRYPMERWSTNESAELAQRLTGFLKAQKLEKTPKIEPVLAPLASVIRHSPMLMIVMVTSGKTPMAGSQWDDEINAYYREHVKDFQKKKLPFVTIFLARDGKLQRHSVSAAAGDVKIPKPPPEPPKKPQTTAAPTNAPAAAPAPVEKKADKALVITKTGAVHTPLAQAEEIAKTTPPAPATTPKPEPSKIEPKADVTPVPAPLTAVVISSEEKTYTIEPKSLTAAQSKPDAASHVANAAPEPTQTQAPKVEPPKVEAQKVETPKPAPAPAQPTVATQPTPAPAPIVTPAAPKKEVAQSNPTPAPALPIAQTAPTPQPAAQQPVTPTTTTPSAPPTIARDSEAVLIEAAKKESPSTPAPEPTKATAQPSTSSVDTPPAPAPVTIATTTAPTGSQNYFVIGIALSAVAIVLAFFIGRATARRKRESLVSHWAAQEKK